MLWTIIVVFLILCLFGFTLHVTGLLHLLLGFAIVVLIFNKFTGRHSPQ